MNVVHYTVMLREVLEHLVPADPDNAVLVDCTLGEGGHSLAFLEKYPKLQVVGVDADSAIQAKARQRLEGYGSRIGFVNSWFDDFLESADRESGYDLILMDLGVSMFHFKESRRGFTFLEEEELDMRLNRDARKTAADIVNTESEADLADILYLYGEERLSRRIARLICEERQRQPFEKTARLADVIRRAYPPKQRYGRIHPATRSFQALRIAVNEELDRLERALSSAFELLKPDGRLGVITFHSLEDRIVKHRFRDLVSDKPELYRLPFRKPRIPSEDEIAENSASRSAKFRVLEKIGGADV